MYTPHTSTASAMRRASRWSRRLWWLALVAVVLCCATAAVAAATDAAGDDDVLRQAPSAAVRASAAPLEQQAPKDGVGIVVDSGDGSIPGAGFGHKPLFPLDRWDVVAFVFAAIGLIIAAAGGIGGGGILVPLYMLVLGFDTKSAVALSNVTIFGSAISNVALAWRRRHPTEDRPLIEWTLVMIMEPPVIAGAVLGALANKVLPSLVVTICLVLLLCFLAKRTMTKGLKLWRQEGGWHGVFGHGGASSLPTAGGSPPRASTAGETSALLAGKQQTQLQQGNGRGYGGDGGNTININTLADLDEDAIRRVKDRERKVRWWMPLLLSLCFLGMALLQILKSATPCGTPLYWALALAVIPWVLPFFLVARNFVLRDYHRKVLFHYPFATGDVKWDAANSLRYPLACSIAGLSSGLFGIGGGMVKAPLMLEMGVLPAVSAATVATMILLTTGASTISLAVLGMIPWDYGRVFFFFGMAATGVGAAAVKNVLQRRKKSSPVVLSVGIVITLSALCMGAQSLLRLAASPQDILKVGSLCGPGTGE